MELRTQSHAAVRGSSSRRSSSCGSDDADSTMQPTCPHQIADSQHDLQFVHARHDGSPPRASRQSFENHLATIQSPIDGTVNPEVPTEHIRTIDRPIHQPSRIPPIAVGPLSDGVDAESATAMHDPFPDHPTSHAPLPDSTSEFPLVSTFSALTSHLTQVPHGQQGSSSPAAASTSHDPSASPYHRPLVQEGPPRNIPFRSPTPPATQPQSQPPSQSQVPDSLSAPFLSYDDQRATPPLHPSTASLINQATAGPPPTAPPGPQTNQPTRPTSNPPSSHQPPVQRNRRRRRFIHWLRRRFRRQLPWLEGWLHGREGSERREATRAIRAAEEVGL